MNGKLTKWFINRHNTNMFYPILRSFHTNTLLFGSAQHTNIRTHTYVAIALAITSLRLLTSSFHTNKQTMRVCDVPTLSYQRTGGKMYNFSTAIITRQCWLVDWGNDCLYCCKPQESMIQFFSFSFIAIHHHYHFQSPSYLIGDLIQRSETKMDLQSRCP